MYTNREYLEMLLLRGAEITENIPQHLPLDLRDLFVHYVLDGATIIDIADSYKCARKTIRRRLQRMFQFIEREYFIDYVSGKLVFTPIAELVFVHCIIKGEPLDTLDSCVGRHQLEINLAAVVERLKERYDYNPTQPQIEL